MKNQSLSLCILALCAFSVQARTEVSLNLIDLHAIQNTTEREAREIRAELVKTNALVSKLANEFATIKQLLMLQSGDAGSAALYTSYLEQSQACDNRLKELQEIKANARGWLFSWGGSRENTIRDADTESERIEKQKMELLGKIDNVGRALQKKK